MQKDIDRIYLLYLWRLVAPEVKGPYENDKQRLRTARRIRKREGDCHGLYRLTLVDDDQLGIRPVVKSFEPGELVRKDFLSAIRRRASATP